MQLLLNSTHLRYYFPKEYQIELQLNSVASKISIEG